MPTICSINIPDVRGVRVIRVFSCYFPVHFSWQLRQCTTYSVLSKVSCAHILYIITRIRYSSWRNARKRSANTQNIRENNTKSCKHGNCIYSTCFISHTIPIIVFSYGETYSRDSPASLSAHSVCCWVWEKCKDPDSLLDDFGAHI